MRTHVSKVLIGTALANTSIAQVDLAALTEGQIIAFDYDTRLDLVAGSKNIAFARGTANLGEPIVAGPIAKASISSAYLNPYQAAVLMKETLTVSTVPTVGKTAIFKIAYHDNLSIIPNQIKQTVVAVVATAVNTATTTLWAAAIAAEFNKQKGGFLFATVTSATNVVTFTAITLLSQSSYNGIDRPESVVFEVGAPNDPALGVYVVARTVAPVAGQGDAAKMAWLEEQHMGRRGYSDRRSWNNPRSYKSQVTAGETYATLVVTGDVIVEGDMQDTRSNPIGAIIGGSGATLATILTDLATAGVVPETIN